VADVLWRIARRPYALDRLGVGARDHGGRWSLPGTAAIYTGQSIAIAALETLVHTSGVVPPDLVVVRVDLPDPYTAEAAAPKNLPRDWHSLPPRPGSMNFGSQWARENRSLVLYVPSVVIPEALNGVLNPNHPEFRGVEMTIERDFHYDPRIFVARSSAPPAP
jgi:RES domain-containing protein